MEEEPKPQPSMDREPPHDTRTATAEADDLPERLSRLPPHLLRILAARLIAKL